MILYDKFKRYPTSNCRLSIFYTGYLIFSTFTVALLSLLFFITGQALAEEPPGVEWEKTYSEDGYDKGSIVQQTSDGGYIILSDSSSFGTDGLDIYLTKTDGAGNVLWQNNYGHSKLDSGDSVLQTGDGGYIIIGDTISTGSNSLDVYLVKTDSIGNVLWEKTYGDIGIDSGNSVKQTIDGGYIIAGETNSFGGGDYDVYLIKTDGEGNSLWEKTFGGSKNDHGNSMQLTSDGGYIIAGCASSFGSGDSDIYMLKTDASGDIFWENTYGGNKGDHSHGQAVQQTKEGEYIIVGTSASYGSGENDIYLVKTDASGKMLWEKTFGGSMNDVGYSVQQTKDNGYILVGGTKSCGAGQSDIYLVKTDASGNVLWDKTFGGSLTDVGYSVQQTSDEGYIITGSKDNGDTNKTDIFLLKLKPDSSNMSDYQIKVLLNGNLINFDVPPVIINDRIIVPIRILGEAFGAKVDWNDETKTVTITRVRI